MKCVKIYEYVWLRNIRESIHVKFHYLFYSYKNPKCRIERIDF